MLELVSQIFTNWNRMTDWLNRVGRCSKPHKISESAVYKGSHRERTASFHGIANSPGPVAFVMGA
jgi:hypothetical protein